MAASDDTASGRSSLPHPKSHNPLGRPFWTLTFADSPEEHLLATLSGIAMGIHALARVLANGEAFREAQASNAEVEPGYWPLAAPVTEGLFAALYFLSEQAETLTEAAMEPGAAAGD